MKYTLTRALSELKTLKARYEKEVSDFDCISVMHGKKLRKPFTHIKAEDFEKKAKSSYQSLEALEKRIAEIKTKIDKANFETKVRIGSEEMTIQEALIMKSTILPLKECKLDTMKRQYLQAQREFENATNENKARVEQLVRDQCAGGSKDTDLEERSAESIDSIYKVAMVDPVGIEKEIEKLEYSILDFKTNVDFALSEINSTTFIDVDD